MNAFKMAWGIVKGENDCSKCGKFIHFQDEPYWSIGECRKCHGIEKAWSVVKYCGNPKREPFHPNDPPPMPQLGERILLDDSADITIEEARADEAAGRGKVHRLPNGSYEFVGYR
jgi:hypothetical protein